MKESIIFLRDFPGSMLDSARMEDGIARMEIKKEAITKGYRLDFDYNLHFHFGVINQGPKRTITFLFDCDPDENLKRELNLLWVSRDDRIHYDVVGVKGRMNDVFPVKYSFDIVLESGETMYIANFPPLDHREIEASIAQKAKDVNAERIVYGKSVEGRDLYYYRLMGPDGGPSLMFVAGYHPPEMDPASIEAILGSLSDYIKRDRITSKYTVIFIPFLNPDGFHNYLQGSNVDGVNFHWHFFKDDRTTCKEAEDLWKLCRELRPVFYMDFHAFTFQSWKARPYTIPKGFIIGKKARSVQTLVDGSLKYLCEGRHSISEKVLAPDILVTRLREVYGTITSPKFHLNWQDGPERCDKLSIDVFDSIVSAFDRSNIVSSKEILLAPFGDVRKTPIDDLRIKLFKLYYLFIRPEIAGLKGVLFGGKKR